jgi:hypothetical protein
MRTFCVLFIAVFCLFSAVVSGQQMAPSILWQKSLGGTKEDKAYAIIKTVDNGFLAVGSSKSNDGDVTGHHGSTDTTDAWVVKLSSTGSIEWQRSMGGSSSDEFRAVISTSDGGYLCIGNTASVDGDVVGQHGGMDIWVVKFSRSGSVLWTKCFGGSSNDLVGISSGSAGNIKQFSNGDFYLIGNTYSNNGDVAGQHNPSFLDIWVVRFTLSGSIVWQKCFGGSSNDYGYDITETENNSFLLAVAPESNDGDFGAGCCNSPRGAIVKVDSNRVMIWKTNSDNNYNRKKIVAPLGNNEYFIFSEHQVCPPQPDLGIKILKFSNVPGQLSPPALLTIDEFRRCGGGTAYYEYRTDGPSGVVALNSLDILVAGYTLDSLTYPGHHGLYDGMASGLKNGTGIVWRKLLGGNRNDHLISVAAPSENEFVLAGYSNSNDGDVSGNHGDYDVWIIKLGKTNTIKGTVYLDYNGNGVKDSNEQFANNILVESFKDSVKAATVTYNGLFSNSVDTGNYSTQIRSNIPYYYSLPLSKSTIFNSYNNTDSVSFALQPIANQRDYTISLFSHEIPRPGFNISYIIQYGNLGTDTLRNKVVKLIASNKLTYLSAFPSPFNVSNDTIMWQIATLNPRDTGSISVTFKIGNPPIASIGDTINTAALIDTAGDLSVTNNFYAFRQFIRGSFDPNDKTESRGGIILKEDVVAQKDLTYIIRFQNIGNDTAFNIVVRDTLDTRLDSTNIEMVQASHPYDFSIKNGNKLTWTFSNILLPDSNRNEPVSHGYIVYRIKPKPGLNVGDTIKNSASIYFDFNLPVKTNTQVTVIKSAPPAKPVLTGIQNDYCSNQGIQKGKITNLPSASSGTTATAKLDGNNLPIAADSTFSFDVSTLTAGSHSIIVLYSNSTASDSVTTNFTVTAAAIPEVNVSANITNITSLANPVVVTATNAAGGGTTPLYTFASDRSFNTILQTEGNNNTLNINPATLLVGDNWIYVRMKTSLSCYTTQTNVDSILLKRDAITGIMDVDDPSRVINIYPNPFNKQINIKGLNPTKSYEITIVDINGKQIFRKQVQNSAQVSLPLKVYNAGIFVLNLYDHRKQQLIGSVRLMKQ